ncbi:MAG: ribonuclease H [Mariniphaga sp.]|nr:ribonuclease H [Mariniphaga sp.]
MIEVLLFTDGSVNTKTNAGYGAYLIVTEKSIPLESLKAGIKVRTFENTTSTKLELQTLLWALSEIELSGRKVIIYTDSQNIIGLPERRERFEKTDYHSKNNRKITNAELYKEFYHITDQLECEFVKVQGHQRSKQKDEIARIFTLVDRASRKALRAFKKQ